MEKPVTPKKAVAAKPAAKKPVAKKPVAKKPAARKTAAKAIDKPIANSVAKSVPKLATTAVPLAKAPAAPKAKPVAAPTAKAAVAPKAKAPAAPKVKVHKPKLVRDSFTMPDDEYAVLGLVKKACLKAGIEVKKSELLRAGVAMLKQLDLAALKQVLAGLPQLKTGRPKKS